IDEVEKDRPGPSYTVDTLTEFHRRHPGGEFFLLIGADTFNDLPNWYHPERVVELAGLIVTTRPDVVMKSPEEIRRELRLPEGAALRLQVVEFPPLSIASTDLRRRAAEGRSLRYLVPRAVECYIQEKRLYQQ